MKREVVCGDFRDLQARFLNTVKAERAADPFAPLRVVVPGHLLRLHLKRELARHCGGHANLRFMTLHDLAQASAARAMVERDLRILKDVALSALIERAVDRAGRLRYFDALRHREGFRRALWATLDDLRGAAWTPQDLRKAAGRTGPAQKTLRSKLEDLAAVWDAMNAVMIEHRLVDRIRLLELACESNTGSEDTSPVIIYGLDALTGLQFRFVSGVTAEVPCSVYLPHRPVWADWTQPLLERFLGAGFRAIHLEPDPATGPAMLRRVQLGVFAQARVDAAAMPPPDDSFLLVDAPGQQREVEQIVRELFYSPLAESSPRSVAVIVRNGPAYNALLRENFSRSGVTGYFHENSTLADTPAGQICRYATRLLDGELARADVNHLLQSALVRWPVVLPGGPLEIPAAEWNQYSLEAGISKGPAVWFQSLRRLRNLWKIRQAEIAVEDEAGLSDAQDRLASLRHLQRFLAFLTRQLIRIESAPDWATMADRFAALLQAIVADDPHADVLIRELSGAADLDELHCPKTVERFQSFVAELLSRPVSREGRFQVHEPTVADPSQIAGLLFDEVLIPGNVEKEIPRPAPQDPLLLDEERAQTAVLAQHEAMPLRSRDRERERYLYLQALCSARKRLVLLFPRREASSSRERLPSTYILNVVEAATGVMTDYDALHRFIASSPWGLRLPMSRLTGQRGDAISEFHFVEAGLGEALRVRSLLPLAYPGAANPFFMRGLAAERARFERREFGRFDGVVEDPVLRNWLVVTLPRLTPNAMAEYLNCPFRYFATRLLDAVEQREDEGCITLHSLQRGALVHDILRIFFSREQAQGALPLRPDSAERALRVADEVFALHARENPTGPAILWENEMAALRDWIRNTVAECVDDPSGFVPRYFNRQVRWNAENMPVTYHGRIDRIDVAPDGRARIIDYSSGTGSSAEAKLRRSFALPLQRLAVEDALGIPVESAETVYLPLEGRQRHAVFTDEDWNSAGAGYTEHAARVQASVTQGLFFPYPADEKCARCPARTACGSGPMTPKWHDPDPRAAAFLQLVEDLHE